MATERPQRFTAGRSGALRVRQETTTRSGGLISAAFLLTALFLTPLVLRPASVETYYLALFLTVLTTLPLVTRVASGTFDVFEPIIAVSLLIAVAFGVRTMYLAYAPNTLLPLQMGALGFDDFVSSALVLTIAAYCSLLVGYYVIAGPIRLAPLAARRLGRRAWSPSKLNGAKIAALLGIAALFTVTNRPSSFDVVTSSTTVVATLASLASVAGCSLALYIAAGDDRRWLRLALWCGALPLAVWQSLAFGAKAPALLLLYAVIASYHYAKRRIPLRHLMAGAAVAVLLVFPLVNVFRAEPERLLAASGARPTMAEFVGRVRSIPTLFAQMSPAQYVQLAAEGVMARSTGVDSLSLLLKYDVSAELGNPAAYFYIPAYAFIPRVIWPTKPVLNQGTRFGRLLVVPSSEGRNSVSSFGIFHIGDLFVSFGVAGVLIGICALGCLYRLLYRFFDPMNTPDLGVKFLYIFLLWGMVNGFESDIPSVYANLLKSLLVWALIKSWLNAPSTDNVIRPSPAAGSRWDARLHRPVPNPVPNQSRVIHPGAARSNLVR